MMSWRYIPFLLLSVAAVASAISYSVFGTYNSYILLGLFATVVSAWAGGWRLYVPQVWLAVASFLYSYSASILNFWYGYGLYVPNEVVVLATVFHLPLCITLAVCAARPADSVISSGLNSKFLKFNLALSGVVVVLNNITFMMSGSASKREFWDAADAGFYLSFGYNYIVISLVLLVVHQWLQVRKVEWHSIGLVFLLALFTLVNTGERDLLFMTVLALTFAFLYFEMVPRKSVYIAVLLCALFVPFSKSLGVFIHKQDAKLGGYDQSLVASFLMSDFHASGVNTGILLLSKDIYKGNGLERLSSDVARGLLPGLIARVDNTRKWYYDHYTPYVINRHMPGLGFTLMGSCYIYGGYIGVLVGAVIFGLMVELIWRRAQTSELWFVYYSVVTGLLIWSLRGDLSAMISSLVKQSLLPLLMLLLISRLTMRSFYRK